MDQLVAPDKGGAKLHWMILDDGGALAYGELISYRDGTDSGIWWWPGEASAVLSVEQAAIYKQLA